MELKDYWRVLRTRWRLFVAFISAGLVTGVGLTMLMPSTYTAQTELFVAPEAGSSTAELMQGSTFILNRVKSYVQVVNKDVVLQPVIDELGLDDSVAELAERVEASVITETVVVTISVDDHSPTRAALIANTIADEFSTIAPELEPARADETAVVRVTVINPAAIPLHASSPSLKFNTALGLLAGLALGLGAAVFREFADRRIRGEGDLRAITPAPVIGHVPIDEDAQTHPLIVGANAHGARAEAIRQVRTNLQFLPVRAGRRSYVITSSLPGEGKSATAMNLALMLAETGQRVCFVEADLRRPSGGRYLDLESSVGLTNILISTADRADVTQPWGPNGMDVILSGPIPPNPSELLAGERMERLVRELEIDYDVVIVDSPPLLPVTDGAILARWCAGAIVLVGTGRKAVTRTDLQHSLEKLDTVGATLLGVVLNRLPVKGPDAVPISLYTYDSDPSRVSASIDELVLGDDPSTEQLDGAPSPGITPTNGARRAEHRVPSPT
ncbi:MAG: polysaccharide biosynthesis tyrosine autokinase [Propionibacteriaceae bacterium]